MKKPNDYAEPTKVER